MGGLVILLVVGLFAVVIGDSIRPATGLTVAGAVLSFVVGVYIVPDIGMAVGIGVLGGIATAACIAWLMKPRRRHWP